MLLQPSLPQDEILACFVTAHKEALSGYLCTLLSTFISQFNLFSWIDWSHWWSTTARDEIPREAGMTSKKSRPKEYVLKSIFLASD